MLSKSLSSFFSKQIQERGRGYFASGQVEIQDGDATNVIASVLGSRAYDVTLDRDGDTIEAWCTCPYCQDEFEPCKHIWATLLAAESRGLLQGNGRQPIRDLFLVEPEDWDDFEGDEADEDDEFGEIPTLSRAVRSRSQAAVSRSRPGPSRRRPPAWKAALASLRAAAQRTRASRVGTPGPESQILYLIDGPNSPEDDQLVVEVAWRTRKKTDGEWSQPRARRFGMSEVASLPEPVDRQALAILAGGREQVGSYYYDASYYDTVSSRFLLTPQLGLALLPLLCSTGRCSLKSPAQGDGLRPLRWDDAGPWEFRLKVTRDDAGKTYAITGELCRGPERLELQAPALLVGGGFVFRDDRVAPLAEGQAVPWMTLLREHGKVTVPTRQKDELLADLLRLPDLPRLDLPEELRYEEFRPAPRPYLKIKKKEKTRWDYGRDKDLLVGKVSFDYDGHLIPAEDPAPSVYEPEKRRLLLRDPEAEQTIEMQLAQVGFRLRSEYGRGPVLELPASKLPKAARILLRDGWRIEAEGKLYREAGAFRIEVTSGIDWFELHGGARFGDQEVPLPTLLAALKRGDDLVPLSDGGFGLLPEQWLKKYGMLAQAGAAEEDHLRFGRTQVGLLDVLLSEQPEVRFDKQFERARERLRQFQGVRPADPPAGFRGELRGYQRDGLGWLHFLREFGFGGCLADDMGLGKTVQVLALLESRRELRAATRKRGRPAPSLVVVPRSLVFNWKQEAARFAPELRILDHTGIGREKPGAHFDDYDLVVTTYGTLRRDIVDLKDYSFDYAILDEAQAIKNASSQSAKAARLLRADHRLALSGTPVENHLGELWSLFEFLNPGMLGQTDASLRKPDEEGRSLLARVLRPYILRRTKEQVARDLPEKNEQTIYCDLEPRQRKLYNELREHYRQTLLGRVASQGLARSKIQVLEALLRLRQAACHPGLIDKARYSKESSAKLDALLPQLIELFESDHKTLVFSQFTSFLAIVKQRLDAENIPYEYLDGRTRDRQSRVVRFQTDPDCKVFLISLKAGGLGLNLTAADYVFLLDPWWNPAVESQAIDRAHRIGQPRPVFAYRLIARDTVEEKVLQLQTQKRALADAIITADNSLIRDLRREDLELLLS